MSYRPVPYDPEGYALASDSLVVHTRYARHVSGLRRVRTIDAVYSLISEYAEPVPCDICYPPPPKVERSKPRRVKEPEPEVSASWADVEPVPVDPEPED